MAGRGGGGRAEHRERNSCADSSVLVCTAVSVAARVTLVHSETLCVSCSVRVLWHTCVVRAGALS